jgi:FlaA1/EpsC-like NDP-sugar epimerase
MRMLDDARVLITGGTGSLGQTLVRRLLSGTFGSPEKITVFSRDEAKHYAMKVAWKHAYQATDDIYYHNFDELIEFRIGDVRDYDSVHRAVAASDIVFHAAAMKQVPICEYFPGEAAATNIRGAENVVRAVRATERVRTLVGVSTDKACKPINVMGMTKAVQERMLVEGNLHQDHARMVVVRYGNVVSSRGSVIPLFKQQINHGGPVTITLPEMTRFLLTLDRAVDTIFAAVEHARPGEVYVPRVPSARIVDVAELLIGDKPIEVLFSGIRPAEKIHEILVSEEEAFRTIQRNGYYVIQPQLPELSPVNEPRALSGDYSSADALVSGAELSELVAQADFIDPAMVGGTVSVGTVEIDRIGRSAAVGGAEQSLPT